MRRDLATATMAIFSFSRDPNSSDTSKNEKRAGSPPSPQADVPGEGYTSEEGAVEVEDDLHRGMRPRQLSGFAPMHSPQAHKSLI